MYTSEFIEKVEAMNLSVVDTSHSIFIKNKIGEIIATVSKKRMFGVDTRYSGFVGLTDGEKIALFHLLTEYAKTSIDEREPEREFRLRAKELLNVRREDAYLNYFEYEGKLFMGTKEKVPCFKTIFTDSELKELFSPKQLEWIEMTFDREVE